MSRKSCKLRSSSRPGTRPTAVCHTQPKCPVDRRGTAPCSLLWQPGSPTKNIQAHTVLRTHMCRKRGENTKYRSKKHRTRGLEHLLHVEIACVPLPFIHHLLSIHRYISSYSQNNLQLIFFISPLTFYIPNIFPNQLYPFLRLCSCCQASAQDRAEGQQETNRTKRRWLNDIQRVGLLAACAQRAHFCKHFCYRGWQRWKKRVAALLGGCSFSCDPKDQIIEFHITVGSRCCRSRPSTSSKNIWIHGSEMSPALL